MSITQDNAKSVNNPSPFIAFTARTIPATFDTSMSYQEALYALLDYLQNQVTPVVNDNAQMLQELKDFTVHYFDNLDVQEEINNKLDDMAESGELQEIITAYLQVSGVLCYNTLSDMQNASNLIEGSFARTFGKVTYNDGKGELYKIRTMTSGDVVDGDNIVSVNFSNTLIGEKQQSYRLNTIESDINTVETGLDTLNTKLYGDKILCIGDSFIGQYQSDNWAIRLCNKLGYGSTRRTIIGEGGAGIYNESPAGHNFEDVLDLALPSITDKGLYSKIIIGGGTNDMNATSVADILTPMESLINKCKTNFPNAKVYIAEFGWFMNYSNVLGRGRINAFVIPAYKQCTRYGGIYLNNVEYCFRDQALYESTDPSTQDLVHPNTQGQEEIACAIFQALNGSYRPYLKSSNIKFPVTDDVTESNLYFTDYLYEGKHLVNLNGSLTIAKTYTGNGIVLDLGILGNPFIRKDSDNVACFAQVDGRVYSPTKGNIPCAIKMDIDNTGHFRATIPNGLPGGTFDITSVIFSTVIEFTQQYH